MQVLQQEANEYNKERDYLIEQKSYEPVQADLFLSKQKRQDNQLKDLSLPLNNNKTIEGVNVFTTMHYNDSHLRVSSLKEQTKEYDNEYNKYKTIKQNESLRTQYQNNYEKQKEIDDKRKQTLFKQDRVGQQFETKQYSMKSVAQQDLEQNERIKKELDTKDKRHFNKKNELIEYADAYLINKNFLRGAPKK